MSADREARARREPKTRRPRRVRSASESLLSIALGLEAALVFFVALAVFRFDRLPPSTAFGGGVGVILILLIAARMLRFRFGVWLGWVLQAALIATGFLLSLMFFIGAGFAAIWVFCFVTGARLDRRTRASTTGRSAFPTHAEPPSRRIHD